MIVNFHEVIPSKLYRSGQPTPTQWPELKALGINMDIDLREPFDRSDEDWDASAAGITHHNIPVGDLGDLSMGIFPPSVMQLTQIFALIRDPDNVSLVHCAHGDDRTGAVIAAYRVQYDGWTAADALQEAVAMGLSTFQLAIHHWIADFKPIEGAPA